MENNEFKIGDVVGLNGNSSPKLTISFVGATSVNVLYVNNGKVEHFKDIPKKCLTKLNNFKFSDDQKRFLMGKRTDEEIVGDIKALIDGYSSHYVLLADFKDDLKEVLKKALNPLKILLSYRNEIVLPFKYKNRCKRDSANKVINFVITELEIKNEI